MVQVSCTMASRVYVICTLCAVLLSLNYTQVQITYTLEAMVQLTCTILHC